VDCLEVANKWLVAEFREDLELMRHVAECTGCSRMARGLLRVDTLVAAAVVVTPPLELQRRLSQLVIESTRPAPLPWYRQIVHVDFSNLLARPQMVAVQGFAALMLALASWQIFGWVSAVQPVIGDVGYAMELVAASPAAVYLGSVQIDFQSLGIWSVVGIAGWLISENGVIGRRLASGGQRVP
jgi:hypothetical protein